MALHPKRPRRPLRFLAVLPLAAALLLLPAAPALGEGDATSDDPIVTYSTTDASLACGLHHSLVLNYDGRVLSFGDNSFGQLGDGTNVNRSIPTELAYPTDVVGVAAGFWHSLAVTSDGSVYVWGRNLYGQLGTGDTRNASQPVMVEGLPPVAAVAAGAHHSLALTMDGAVYAWGRNTEFQVGEAESEVIEDSDGTTLGTRVTTPVLVIAKGAVAIAGGQYFTMALLADGTVLTFGSNDAGQLGDGTRISRAAPAPVEELDRVVAIAAGADHALVVKETEGVDGTVIRTVWGWGSDAAGQLGQGRMPGSDPYRLLPVRIDLTRDDKPENDTVSLIAAGAGVSLFVSPFLDRTGSPRARLLVCGSNMEGALGLGDVPAVTRPQPLKATSNGWTGSVFLPFEAIATSGAHTLMLGVKGQLGSMGRNDAGQLGDSSYLDYDHPVESSLPDRIEPAFRTGAALTVDARGPSSLSFSWPQAVDNRRVAGYELRYIDPDGETLTVDFGESLSGSVDGYDPTAPQVFRLFAYDDAGNASPAGLAYEFVPDGMTYEQAFPTDEPELPEPTPETTPETTPEPTEAPEPTVPAADPTPVPSGDVTPEPTEAPDITPSIVPLDPGGLPGPGWNPDDFGTPIPLEVPWDVDGFYGKGVILPPFSLTPSSVAMAAGSVLGLLLPSIYLVLRKVEGIKG